MESKISEEKVQKEINKLESFLSKIRAKYIIKNRSIILNAKVIENVLNFENLLIKIKIQIDSENELNIKYKNQSIILETYKENKLITEIFYLINSIINEEDKVYIYF